MSSAAKRTIVEPGTKAPLESGETRHGINTSRWITSGIILLAIVLFFVIAGDDWFTIVNNTLIAAIAALALNVLSGYTGQISLGISFFMAIGAYTAALLGGDRPTSSLDPLGLGLPFIVWLPAAGIVAALIGALIGPTALRLKGFYLAIVTLALVFIGNYLFINIRPLTGGPQGRTFPAPAIGEICRSLFCGTVGRKNGSETFIRARRGLGILDSKERAGSVCA